MKKIIITVLFLILLTPLVCVDQADASITFNFTSTVDSVLGIGGISPGDVVTGHFTFDPLISDSDASSTVGEYMQSGLGIEFAFSVGPLVKSSTDYVIKVTDGNGIPPFPFDGYTVSTPAVPGEVFSLNLSGAAPTTLLSDALPLSPPNLADFSGKVFSYVQNSPSDTIGFNSTITSLNAVPIPGAVWLLGSGLIGLVGLRKKGCRKIVNSD